MRISLAVLLAAVLLAVLTSAVIVSPVEAICSINDPARFACIDLVNQTARYVTAYWDGNNYGCNTAPGTTCSFIVSVGTHSFTARANDGTTVDLGRGYVKPGCCDDAHRLVVWDVR